MKLDSGARLGPYEILSQIGSGGMGEVYRARDTQLGRDVAIKVLHREAAASEARLKRFVAEAKAASALNHPNILTVYSIGEENKSPYIVTEFIQGATVRALLARGPIPIDQAIEVTSQILAGLIKAHSVGIVHRDLKPENVMITADGYAKILDFGLAKLLKEDTGDRGALTFGITETESGMILGTASYMSPEQARGQSADVRSDLFSLGLILYEMLSGENPFRRATSMDTISAVLRDHPPPLTERLPKIPPELAAIVDRAMKKEPAERYQSAREMETALQTVRQKTPGPISITAPTPGSMLATAPFETAVPPKPARHMIALALLLGATMIAFVLYFIFQNRRTPEAGATLPVKPVIAVMAIDNKTSDPDLAQSEVGRILSDAFVQILYDCRGIQVVSPLKVNSILDSFGERYDHTANDTNLAQKVCVKAGANTVLSGNLSQIGETFILNATLTEISSGRLLGNFRAESKGKSNLLTALTQGVAISLKATLSSLAGMQVTGGKDLGAVATTNVEAYAHYIRGLDLSNIGEWKKSIEEINKALALDPDLGPAWSVLACSYSFLGDDANAAAAMQKALELRPRMSRKEREWVEATSLWISGNHLKYRETMQTYVRNYPDDREGYFYLGLGYEWLENDCPRALIEYEKAFRITPNHWPITKAIVDCREKLGEKDKAIAAVERYLMVPNITGGRPHAQGRLAKLKS